MHAFSQAALKFARIDLWGRSEPGNTHLILIERERRAGILTPPGRVILRQCSSRRGKHSMRGLVQLSRQRGEAVPLRSLYDPGLDLQLTSRRALGESEIHEPNPARPIGRGLGIAEARETVVSESSRARAPPEPARGTRRSTGRSRDVRLHRGSSIGRAWLCGVLRRTVRESI